MNISFVPYLPPVTENGCPGVSTAGVPLFVRAAQHGLVVGEVPPRSSHAARVQRHRQVPLHHVSVPAVSRDSTPANHGAVSVRGHINIRGL